MAQKKSAKIVIGSFFGDEGKGKIVDYLAFQQESTLVIRFTGGAQASHTVQLPSGERHAFSHFGSGTFVCAPTFLSRFFICNPMLWKKEKDELDNKTKEPIIYTVYVDPDCLVTTPYDMFVNQLKEQRGEQHGSVGVGIYETILRNKTIPLTLNECGGALFRLKIEAIRAYAWGRLRDLKINLTEEDEKIFYSPQLLEDFIRDTSAFLRSVEVCRWKEIARHYDTLIFEGSQGLLLDQNFGYWPNVTPGNTGIKNVYELLRELNEEIEIETIYVTRAYITRHGKGNLPFELKTKPFEKINDSTNKNHEFQGSLRFAYFQFNLLRDAIFKDLAGQYFNDFQVSLAINCLDETSDKVTFFDERGRVCNIQNDWFARLISSKMIDSGIKIRRLLEGWGPSRNDVRIKCI